MPRRICWLACGSLLGLLCAGLAGGGLAAPLACDATAFSGQVTKTGLPLTVRGTDGKERAVSAGPGLVVVRNGATAGLSDVRQGDQVNVTVPAGAAECAATRIEASSAPVSAQRDRTGLWGLLGLVGLAGLLPLLRDRFGPGRRAEHTNGFAPAERVAHLNAAPPERGATITPAEDIPTRPLRR